jgi:hypothetical protein
MVPWQKENNTCVAHNTQIFSIAFTKESFALPLRLIYMERKEDFKSFFLGYLSISVTICT